MSFAGGAMALKRVDLPPEHGDFSGELMIHQEFTVG
jgi:hypothetical protein